MENKTLTELLSDLEQEMLRRGYTKGSMQIYRGHWKMLLQFAQERGELFYSEQLGIDFIEQHFRISETDNNQRLSQMELHALHMTHMVGYFQTDKSVLYCPSQPVSIVL